MTNLWMALMGVSFLYYPLQNYVSYSSLVLGGVMMVQGVLWYLLLRSETRLSMAGLWVLAALAFLCARSHSPLFEDDYFRYFWDGNQLRQGVSPYASAPQAAASLGAEFLRPEVRFPHLVTFYPPLIQGVFGLLVAISFPSVSVFLWLLALTGSGVALASIGHCYRRFGLEGVSSKLALLAIHPLIVKEWYQSAHYDPWLVGALALAFASHGGVGRGIWLGVGANFKWITLPLLGCDTSLSKRQWGKLLWGLGLGCVLPWLIFYSDIPRVWETLRTFGQSWEMNSGLFRWARVGFEILGFQGTLYPRAFVALCWLGFNLFVFRQEESPVRRAFWMLWSMVWFSPVVNTWYLTWSLPLLLLLEREQGLPMALSLLGAPMTYAFFALKPGEGLEWAWELEHLWGFFFVIVAWRPQLWRWMERKFHLSETT